jgi:hypothetical protein
VKTDVITFEWRSGGVIRMTAALSSRAFSTLFAFCTVILVFADHGAEVILCDIAGCTHTLYFKLSF